jgi:oxygen-dependent protoporphyrinogen oxidase
MAPDPHAIVVGGGIAGLVAARRLALEGREVTLFEASDRLGGQVARHAVGGIELDAGAEAFATRGGTVAALATALGLGDDIVALADTPAWLYRADGSAVPLPATSVLGIPGVPLAADVIAAIGLRAALRAQLDTILPGAILPGSVAAGNVARLVRRRMGRGVLEGLVAPVVRGVHSTTPEELEVESVPGLRQALTRETTLASAVRSLRASSPAGSQVQGIRGGVFRLVDALAAELQRFGVDVQTGVRVTAAQPDGVEVDGERVLGEVWIAAPGVTASEPGRRVTLVTLVVDAPELAAAPRGTGVLVAAGSDVEARALTHVTAKWPWVAEAARGRQVLRLSYDGEPDGIEGRAARDAALLLGTSLPHPDDVAVVTWERAAPAVHAVDGMHRVGEAVSGTGIAAVVAQADAVA